MSKTSQIRWGIAAAILCIALIEGYATWRRDQGRPLPFPLN
jgi:hypothetical protein